MCIRGKIHDIFKEPWERCANSSKFMLMYLRYVYKLIFYIDFNHFLEKKTLNSTTFEAKVSYHREYDIWII
jgi:hypothetical protein